MQTEHRLFIWSVGQRIVGRKFTSSSKHNRPHSDELFLVNVAIIVDVERADKVSRFRLITVECLADDVDQFVWTQHSIAISVKRVETPSDVLVTTSRQTDNKCVKW